MLEAVDTSLPTVFGFACRSADDTQLGTGTIFLRARILLNVSLTQDKKMSTQVQIVATHPSKDVFS